jgi:uncharacterized protein YkwD
LTAPYSLPFSSTAPTCIDDLSLRSIQALCGGEAINAYRAQNGLPAMSISRSGGLVAHAAAMAEKGSIWHSGSDKIVGYVMPSSASALVKAWAASPPHNAWMLRTDKSAMQVGAVELNNKLYGAVNFS